ncbi:shikimate dehydrogenase [Candidatus Pacearchaeota archaeon]|nr:shikimate dehydrogenase [Candidatus Pacearchaeota archaeon]
MDFDKNTVKCVSIAKRPGSFGLNFHNAGYKLFGLNQFYLPLKVNEGDLRSTVQLVRDNFHACSVSMPHKIEVIKYLDEMDSSAESTGAVNTILNIGDGRLKGYNTDYYGAKKAIEKNLDDLKDKDVLMIGSGGVAYAVGKAVNDLGGRLKVTNRTEANAKKLIEKVGAEFVPWAKRESVEGYLLINATSVGMGNSTDMPTNIASLNNFSAVMDVVASNQTKLIKEAVGLGKKTVTGRTMTVYQAEKQFEIYTGKALPESFLEEFLE